MWSVYFCGRQKIPSNVTSKMCAYSEKQFTQFTRLLFRLDLFLLPNQSEVVDFCRQTHSIKPPNLCYTDT